MSDTPITEVSLEDIASLAKRRGFIYQGSEFMAAWLVPGIMAPWAYS
jgi:hypothetical protein